MTGALPATVRLQVSHIHDGNSTYEERGFCEYLTLAKVLDRETNEVLATAEARCNPNDSPNRKRGYLIATERVKKKFLTAKLPSYFNSPEYVA
mgnify:CR=1 FL=1